MSYKLSLFLCSFFLLFKYSVFAAEELEIGHERHVRPSSFFMDDREEVFKGQTEEKGNLKLQPLFIKEDLTGYQVEEFKVEQVNRNHWDSRGGTEIKFLVMHYTHCNFSKTLDLFTRDISDGRVSAHYVISEEEKLNFIPGGKLFQLVPLECRAWHAGLSYWNGVRNINANSIGIENVCRGFEDVSLREQDLITYVAPQRRFDLTPLSDSMARLWFAFDEKQITTLGKLSRHLVDRYKISPTHVVGHADVAPQRKQDPGILFPWQRLYQEFGVGAWLEERDPEVISQLYSPKEPLPLGESDAFFLTELQKYGYEVKDVGYVTPENQEVVKAFKSHFSANQDPANYTSKVRREDMIWAWGLNAKYPAS